MNSWIAQMCVETSRRQFLAWMATFAAGILFLLVNVRYIRNFVQGPYRVQESYLAQITDANKAPRYFVTVVGDKVADTGVQEVSSDENTGPKADDPVTAGYYAFLTGAHVLIVKSAAKPDISASGELKPIPSDLAIHLFTGDDGQDFRTHTYPFYLDTEGFRYPGYWTNGIAVVFLILFVVYGIPAWTRWHDVEKHPVYKRVKEQWGDVIGASVEAEREFRNGAVHRSSQTLITDKYVFESSFFTFNIFRFRDMIWAYKKVIQQKVNFIPAGKRYEVEMIFYGGKRLFANKEAKVDQVLKYAASKAPWAVIGYSKELVEYYNKNQRQFCQQVEARRRQLAGETPAASPGSKKSVPARELATK